MSKLEGTVEATTAKILQALPGSCNASEEAVQRVRMLLFDFYFEADEALRGPPGRFVHTPGHEACRACEMANV